MATRWSLAYSLTTNEQCHQVVWWWGGPVPVWFGKKIILLTAVPHDQRPPRQARETRRGASLSYHRKAPKCLNLLGDNGVHSSSLARLGPGRTAAPCSRKQASVASTAGAHYHKMQTCKHKENQKLTFARHCPSSCAQWLWETILY